MHEHHDRCDPDFRTLPIVVVDNRDLERLRGQVHLVRDHVAACQLQFEGLVLLLDPIVVNRDLVLQGRDIARHTVRNDTLEVLRDEPDDLVDRGEVPVLTRCRGPIRGAEAHRQAAVRFLVRNRAGTDLDREAAHALVDAVRCVQRHVRIRQVVVRDRDTRASVRLGDDMVTAPDHCRGHRRMGFVAVVVMGPEREPRGGVAGREGDPPGPFRATEHVTAVIDLHGDAQGPGSRAVAEKPEVDILALVHRRIDCPDAHSGGAVVRHGFVGERVRGQSRPVADRVASGHGIARRHLLAGCDRRGERQRHELFVDPDIGHVAAHAVHVDAERGSGGYRALIQGFGVPQLQFEAVHEGLAERRSQGVDLVPGLRIQTVVPEQRIHPAASTDGATVEQEITRGDAHAIGVAVTGSHAVGEHQRLGARSTHVSGVPCRLSQQLRHIGADVQGQLRLPRHRHGLAEGRGHLDDVA